MSAAGKQRELARYQLADGTRAVVAQRIDGRVAISDVPVDHVGRVYLIERHVHSQAVRHARPRAASRSHTRRTGSTTANVTTRTGIRTATTRQPSPGGSGRRASPT